MPDQYQPPQQPGYSDPLATSTGWIPPQRYDQDPMMSKHLDSSDILEKLKKMLLGFEYNDEEDEWKQSTVMIGYDKEGKEVWANEEPLMDAKDVRVTISYLQMFLNPNTFLSQIDDARINDIMWDVSKKLGILFYNLRHKLTPNARDMIWGMVEYPILLGLCRANRKITLDAISKMQQTHEIIQGTPKTPTSEQKEFKFLGW